MVDALLEARRVLTPRGILIDVRPVNAPLVIEVVSAARAIRVSEVNSCSAAEDLAASDAAVHQALSAEWFSFEKSHPFELEILCDTAADLSLYAATRKLRHEAIPYANLETQRRALSAGGPTAHLRCRRPWMLSTYRKT